MIGSNFLEGEMGGKLRPGQRLDLKERAEEISKKYTPRGRDVRSSVDSTLDSLPVEPANPNITTSTFAGAIGTFIVWTAEDYLPIRVGADASISNVEVSGNEITYTVDTNAALESQARFRSVLDAGTGVTSLYTDDITVESVELLTPRVGRDTYRYEIVVRT